MMADVPNAQLAQSDWLHVLFGGVGGSVAGGLVGGLVALLIARMTIATDRRARLDEQRITRMEVLSRAFGDVTRALVDRDHASYDRAAIAAYHECVFVNIFYAKQWPTFGALVVAGGEALQIKPERVEAPPGQVRAAQAQLARMLGGFLPVFARDADEGERAAVDELSHGRIGATIEALRKLPEVSQRGDPRGGGSAPPAS